jgi:hypothetical protein
MKKMILAGMVLFLGVSCKGPAEPGGCTPIADSEKEMELVTPISGTFNFGSNVEVAWKVNPKEVDLVVVQVSSTGLAGPWRNVFKEGIPVGSRDVELACMDTVWVVGQEYATVDYTATSTVLLRVAWYNHESDAYDWARDVSSTITINK